MFGVRDKEGTERKGRGEMKESNGTERERRAKGSYMEWKTKHPLRKAMSWKLTSG